MEKQQPREDDSRRRVFPPFPPRLGNSSEGVSHSSHRFYGWISKRTPSAPLRGQVHEGGKGTEPKEITIESMAGFDPAPTQENEIPRLQKCNLCAREKVLPMHRELHLDTRSPSRQHGLFQGSFKVPRLSLVFHNLTSLRTLHRPRGSSPQDSPDVGYFELALCARSRFAPLLEQFCCCGSPKQLP